MIVEKFLEMQEDVPAACIDKSKVLLECLKRTNTDEGNFYLIS